MMLHEMVKKFSLTFSQAIMAIKETGLGGKMVHGTRIWAEGDIRAIVAHARGLKVC